MNALKSLWNKRTRPLLIIVVSLLFAVAAWFYTQQTITKQVQTKSVFVAAQDIEPNSPLTQDSLVQREVVISSVPPDAITDISALNLDDAYASQLGFKKGDVIRQSYVTTAKDSKLGTAVALKDGMVEIGVATDLASTAGNEVRAGMLVHVQAFLTESTEGRGVLKVDPDLTDILVRKVVNSEGYTPEEAADQGSRVPAVVTLEVTPDQASRIMKYQQTGKIFLLPSGVSNNNS